MHSRAIINALFPEGSFWEPAADDDYDRLLDGIGANNDAVYNDLDGIRYLRNPWLTPWLSDLQAEYGVIPPAEQTDYEQRQRLASVMFRKSEMPTYESLESKLQAAGFDVYVYANSPAIDPNNFLDEAFLMMAGELLPGGNDAQAGEAEAQAGRVGGELLVNGNMFTASPGYLFLAGETLAQAGEDDAYAGDYDEVILTPIEYQVPLDAGYWNMIFFVGGLATYADTVTWSQLFLESPEANSWYSVATDGAGIWCAVSASGTNRIMRSTDDGATWASVAAPEANGWRSVATDGAGIWCAVSETGTNRIMRSTDDGATWASVAAPEANRWDSVATDGAGIWCAVSLTGTNRIMRSTDDGATWASVAAPEANGWVSLATDGSGIWCAVSYNGTNRIMRSTDDGATWASVAAPEANVWDSVATDGAGIWCAVSASGTNRIMRSTDDGATWASVAAPEANGWVSLATDGSGIWCAVAYDGTNRIMRSTDDGATWASVAAPEANVWRSVATDGAGIWCAVSETGTNRIMRSTDDGATWERVYLSEFSSWRGVAMTTGTIIGVAYSGDYRIFKISQSVKNAISNIQNANIPGEREREFKKIILQNKPLASWAALIVTWS